MLRSPLCADCTGDSEWESGRGDGGDDTPDRTGSQHTAGGLRRSKRFVRKPSVQTETKYIELMVVNDNDMVSLRKNYLYLAADDVKVRSVLVLIVVPEIYQRNRTARFKELNIKQ